MPQYLTCNGKAEGRVNSSLARKPASIFPSGSLVIFCASFIVSTAYLCHIDYNIEPLSQEISGISLAQGVAGLLFAVETDDLPAQSEILPVAYPRPQIAGPLPMWPASPRSSKIKPLPGWSVGKEVHPNWRRRRERRQNRQGSDSPCRSAGSGSPTVFPRSEVVEVRRVSFCLSPVIYKLVCL